LNKPARSVQPPEKPMNMAGATPRIDTIRVNRQEGETDDQATARELLDPSTRHSITVLPYISCSVGNTFPLPNAAEFSAAIRLNAEQAQQGNLAFMSRTLTAQALALDAIFGEFSRRAALNMNGHLEAAERYMRLALKAQSNSRATMEALAKLHQPREQIVRHVHVNDGGQAIVAEQVNHYAGGAENAETVEQSHATVPVGECSPLPCQDQEGQRVPVASSERQEALPDARWNKSRRTKGKHERVEAWSSISRVSRDC
jgi:hypothetical protein